MIVSTDPAHNLSDAFCQKIGREPTPIEGFDNLSAMEIDANNDMEEMQRTMAEQGADEEKDGGLSSMMSELTNSIPGIDEAMSFSELMKQVQNLDFDVVVFDTAPTGHTLRLLSFPTILEKALGKVMELKDRFGGLIGQATAMMGGGNNPGATQDAIVGRLEETRVVINKVNDAFQDPALTTFVSKIILMKYGLPLYDNIIDSSAVDISHDHVLPKCHRSVSASRNSFLFTRQSDWFKNFPNLVSTPTTLLSTKFFSPKRTPKNYQNGTKATRIRYPRKPRRFAPKCWRERECRTSTLVNVLICTEMIST